MQQVVLDHFLQYGPFTYPGLYNTNLKSLPDDPQKIGELIRRNFIHRTTLKAGNTGTNADMKYGDMTRVPWWRQAEDDNFPTTSAMLAELLRRDSRGLVEDRTVENKLVLTCRYVSILFASILKSKGIPARVRSGFANYFEGQSVAWDHWINQYWSSKENRWITVDIDASWHNTGFDMYDIPSEKFDWSADTWLAVRANQKDGAYFNNAGGVNGLLAISWELFYDLHCLMNNEILYLHRPKIVMSKNFDKLPDNQLKEIDILANLMKNPDEHFAEIQHIWETKREYRELKGGLL